ncbi:MAG: ABC transporter permease [Nitrospirae bacterium]|nr:ABC transporter permease [Candidatus Troglogloeales bacterium]
MPRYLILRLVSIFPIALGVATGVFFLIHLVPGDPIDLMLGESAAVSDRAALRETLHLDEPIVKQYGHFILSLLQGDLGQSISQKKPVFNIILSRYPATLELAVAALMIAVTLAVPLGIFAALRHGSLSDQAILLFSLLGVSIPNFWLGPLLIIFFSLKLNWLPVSGREGMLSFILPALTLGVGMAAILLRITRASALEIIGKEYILTARAKGLPERIVVLKHLFRNALIPLITVLGLQFGALLTGAIITETIFSWPGLGRLTIAAIYSRDYPLVQGCILAVAFTYLLTSLLVDMLYAIADPRVRR